MGTLWPCPLGCSGGTESGWLRLKCVGRGALGPGGRTDCSLSCPGKGLLALLPHGTESPLGPHSKALAAAGGTPCRPSHQGVCCDFLDTLEQGTPYSSPSWSLGEQCQGSPLKTAGWGRGHLDITRGRTRVLTQADSRASPLGLMWSQAPLGLQGLCLHQGADSWPPAQVQKGRSIPHPSPMT